MCYSLFCTKIMMILLSGRRQYLMKKNYGQWGCNGANNQSTVGKRDSDKDFQGMMSTKRTVKKQI
jgi:hypothetical protein